MDSLIFIFWKLDASESILGNIKEQITKGPKTGETLCTLA